LATAISGESAPATYTETRVGETIAGDGLYTRIYRYAKPIFTNVTGTTPDQTINNTRTLGLGEYDPQNDKSGIRRSQLDSSDGIPIDDAAEVRDNQVASSGWAITDVRINDNRDGSATLQRRQTLKRSKTDEFSVGYNEASGSQPLMETVVWHNITDADADLIIADAKI